MAFANIHDIPGVTVAITYWNTVTPVPSPATPLTLTAGVYSLPSAQTEWDRAVFEITSFGAGVLPVTGRITVAGAEVGPPYDGLIGIASSTTFGSTIAQETFAPESPYSGSESAPMNTTNKYFIFGHNSGSGPDIQSLTSLVLEFDGDFPVPDFWTDFAGTFESDEALRKAAGYVIVPEVLGVPGYPPVTQCHDVPDPPGPGGDGGDSPPIGGGGGGAGGPPGEITYPLCVTLPDPDRPGHNRRCCKAHEGAPVICNPI